jgi:surface polysaccharide O-acyltransferase-like enzyme
MGKPRIEEWTQLRSLAFLAIVMQHSIAEYIYRADIEPADSTMLTMMYHMTRFGTPTFVFLSAVLMFYNYDGKLNYFAFIRKRLETVFVPFLFWTIVYWLYVRAFTPSFWQKGGQDWGSLLRELVQPQTGYQLWFILMIIQFYICFPLLAALYRGAKNKINLLDEGRRTGSVLAVLAFAGACYIILLYLSYYRMGYWAGRIGSPWAALVTHRSYSFLMYGFYFVLGAACAANIGNWRAWCTKLLPWCGMVFLGMYIRLGYDVLRGSGETVNLNISTYLKPSTFIIIMAQMLLLYGLLLLLRERNQAFLRLLSWIGTYSFGGYLAHALVIYVIAYFTRPLNLAGSHLPFALLTFALTVLASLGISYALSRMPGARWIVGAGRRKPLRGNKVNDYRGDSRTVFGAGNR